jgi:hypothetical protein
MHAKRNNTSINEVEIKNNKNNISIKEIIKESNPGKKTQYSKGEFKSYNDLLRNPRWQKKRLEIMQRDNWSCRCCSDTESELHVHHLLYSAENPWDEENENLITLCSCCHEAAHYLSNNPTIGMETFILVCKLMDKIEQESIEKFFRKIGEENG